MAFIDGNNSKNFATEGLIQRLHFFCVVKERVMQAHECYTDCNNRIIELVKQGKTEKEIKQIAKEKKK